MGRTKSRWGVGILAGTALLALPAAAAAADRQVTFSKDVAPILQAKCQSCHEPGSIAPMSLRTFQETRPWARAIRDRVSQRQMPPWHIDRGIGIQKFKNDISLSDEQIDTIVSWVDQGALEGNPADMPPLKPVTTTLYWQAERDGFGPPDLIVSAPEYTMPATGQDQWWRPTVPIEGLTEPRYVRMVEIRPTNLKGRKILHHAIVNLVQENDEDAVSRGIVNTRGAGTTDPDIANARPYLMEWAIGKGYDRYPDGTGKVIKPGARLTWDQHVHAAGEAITAAAQVGIWLYPKGQEPKHRIYLEQFAGTRGNRPDALDIQPNAISHTEGFNLLKRNAVITNFQPHFHLRGKAMLMEALLPDGSVQTLSYVDKFNFNWMTNYIYADDVAPAFPKGTIIHVSAYHDNTVGNKSNPDPNQWVGYGDRTVDEMAHAWVNVYYLTDEEYEAYQATHKKPAASTQNQ